MIVSTLPALMAALAPGATITLSAGQWPVITIEGRNFFHPVTIDASLATIPTITLRNVHGVKILGGSYTGGAYFGIEMIGSSHTTSDGAQCRNVVQGCVSVVNSTHFVVTDWSSIGSGGDGVDIGSSSFGVVSHFSVSGGLPPMGAHPDAVQIKSFPGNFSHDIAVSDGSITGDTMGVDDYTKFFPASYNIHITRINCVISRSSCSTLMNNTNSSITNSTATTMPGSRFQAKFMIIGGKNATKTNTTDGARP